MNLQMMGMARMLDQTIHYVRSLQKQVEASDFSPSSQKSIVLLFNLLQLLPTILLLGVDTVSLDGTIGC